MILNKHQAINYQELQSLVYLQSYPFIKNFE